MRRLEERNRRRGGIGARQVSKDSKIREEKGGNNDVRLSQKGRETKWLSSRLVSK